MDDLKEFSSKGLGEGDGAKNKEYIKDAGGSKSIAKDYHQECVCGRDESRVIEHAIFPR
jgi:hypothetical protein